MPQNRSEWMPDRYDRHARFACAGCAPFKHGGATSASRSSDDGVALPPKPQPLHSLVPLQRCSTVISSMEQRQPWLAQHLFSPFVHSTFGHTSGGSVAAPASIGAATIEA